VVCGHISENEEDRAEKGNERGEAKKGRSLRGKRDKSGASLQKIYAITNASLSERQKKEKKDIAKRRRGKGFTGIYRSGNSLGYNLGGN